MLSPARLTDNEESVIDEGEGKHYAFPRDAHYLFGGNDHMSSCRCGCGQDAVVGDFLTGHDQKLRVRLEKDVGGLLVLEELVTAAKSYAVGDLSGAEFEREVRRLLTHGGGK